MSPKPARATAPRLRALHAAEQPATEAPVRAMGLDPLGDSVLESFYRPAPIAREPEPPGQAKAKPSHYKIVCISLYTRDIQRLEAMVTELKRRGHTKANKSQLIRAALDQVDLDKVPRGY